MLERLLLECLCLSRAQRVVVSPDPQLVTLCLLCESPLRSGRDESSRAGRVLLSGRGGRAREALRREYDHGDGKGRVIGAKRRSGEAL